MTEEAKSEVVPTKKKHAFALSAPQGDVQEVFRLLFASDNSLIELFQRDVVITLDDLVDLNRKLTEKLRRNNVNTLTFRTLVRFEDGQAREFGDWDHFVQADWDVPKVIDSISATWRFILSGHDEEDRPHIHNLNILISSSIKPMSVMQAMFSKNFEDLEKLEITAMPMTCRIDFQDHVISQETLSLVSDWNKGLNMPQHVFPFMQWFKVQRRRITSLIRCALPIFTALAAYAYYVRLSAPWGADSPLSTGSLILTVRWLTASAAAIFIARRAGDYLAGVIERNLGRFGRFQAIEITKGDRNKQTQIMAKNSRSFWKFIASGVIATLWSAAGGILAAIMLRKVQ